MLNPFKIQSTMSHRKYSAMEQEAISVKAPRSPRGSDRQCAACYRQGRVQSIGSGRQQPPRAPLSIQGFGGKPLISLFHQRHHQPHQHLPPPSNVITLSSFFGFCAVCVVESKCLSKMHLAQHGVLAAGVCGEI